MRYMIVGGTGTLGNAVIEHLYKNEADPEIHVFSREELKQKNLKKKFPNVICHLGDVSNAARVEAVFDYVVPEVVFHLAALKHVDVAEENPEYCYDVNTLGTMNVARACNKFMTKHMVFCSTDKAVLPINAYGASKLMAEKYLYQMNNRDLTTKFSVFRWANVINSRGSVLQTFIDSLKNEGLVRITDLTMTRFWIHIDDVARFMCENYKNAPLSHALVPEMKASKVSDLADAVARYLGIDNYGVIQTGIRRGEKFHECLWSEHDHCLRSDNCIQFNSDELLHLVRRAVDGN